MTVLFEILAIWLAVVLVSMLVVAYLARRWGHDPFGWLVLAAAMGPFAIIAMVGTRQRNTDIARARPATLHARPPVVIGCDGSPAGAAAARYAAASLPDVPIVLLAVEAHEAEPRTEGERDAQRVRLNKMTASASAILQDAGIPFEEAVAYGHAGEQIVRYAGDHGAHAIVVGRRGSGLSRALLGSVSEHVVRNATQPVVVVS